MDYKLKIVNAEKSYGDQKVLNNFNLYVNDGEFLTLLGPSGSGKTTLLKIITGFERLDHGEIYLDGKNIQEKAPHQRDIGMVFQNYALFPHMTVYENLAFPLLRRKVNKIEIKRRVNHLLNIVQMEEHQNKRPHQLSGGQQQRVALARAIIFNPSILLLDEPLAALDKNLRKKMQEEIKQIQERFRITTISVTHDQEEALIMSDRVCIMNNGSVEQIDTPEHIYKSPKTLFTAKFIGDINLLKVKKIENYDNDYKQILLFDNTAVKVKDVDNISDAKNVLFAIRPEVMFIVNEKFKQINSVKVQIKQVQYLGEITIVKTETKAKENITIKLLNDGYRNLESGQKIVLGWQYDEGKLIRKS